MDFSKYVSNKAFTELLIEFIPYIGIQTSLFNLHPNNVENSFNQIIMQQKKYNFDLIPMIQVLFRASKYNLRNLQSYWTLYNKIINKFDVCLENSEIEPIFLQLLDAYQHNNTRKIDEILSVHDKNTILYSILYDHVDNLKTVTNVNTVINKTCLIDYASLYGSLKCFTFLKENKAEITRKTLNNSILGQNKEIIAACFDVVNPDKSTLECALEVLDFETAIKIHNKFLLDFPLSSVISKFDLTIFIYLASQNKYDVNTLFLNSISFGIPLLMNFMFEKGPNVNYSNTFEVTPLMLASGLTISTIALQLLQNHAKINVTDQFGRSPLMYALKSKNLQIAIKLVELGASTSIMDINNNTLLMYSMHPKMINIATTFLAFGSSINIANKNGITPLMNAINHDNEELVKKLIRNEANLGAADNDGKTVLIYAVEHGMKEVVNTIIQNGVNIDSVDQKGNNALMLAANNYEIAMILIKHGADIYAANMNGSTIFDLAKACKNNELVNELIKRDERHSKLSLEQIIFDSKSNQDTATLNNESQIINNKLENEQNENNINQQTEAKIYQNQMIKNTIKKESTNTFNDSNANDNHQQKESTNTSIQVKPKDSIHQKESSSMNQTKLDENSQRAEPTNILNTVKEPTNTYHQIKSKKSFAQKENPSQKESKNQSLNEYPLQKVHGLQTVIAKNEIKLKPVQSYENQTSNIPKVDQNDIIKKPIEIRLILPSQNELAGTKTTKQNEPKPGTNTKRGWRPDATELKNAIEKNDVEYFKSLAQRNADVNFYDKNSGNTPLIMAVLNNKIEIVSLLLECGAKINTTNTQGKAPISIAREKGFINIVKKLESYSSK